MFLARLHSTVLKLERREEEEEGVGPVQQQHQVGGPVQQQHQVAGHRGTGQLSGYQVKYIAEFVTLAGYFVVSRTVFSDYSLFKNFEHNDYANLAPANEF